MMPYINTFETGRSKDMQNDSSTKAGYTIALLRLASIGIALAASLTSSVALAQGVGAAGSNQATSAWKGIEDAMGRSGQMQPGDVIKFSMPRKDLHVSLDGVSIKPGLALGSWVAFKREGSEAMVMGDL